MASNTFKPGDVPNLSEKVAIVTGGNRSIGLESVYMLICKNCTVWIAGRSESGFEDAKKTLSSRPDVTETMVSRVHFLKLDLAEIKHAEETGKEFAKQHPERLDILLCNAGVSLQKGDQLSSDGYELTFQTNHLGHFAFANTLLPLLEKTAREHGEARVVITSSDAHAFAKSGIDFDALQQTKPHQGMRGIGEAMSRYGVSKLSNMLYARELDKRWAAPLRAKGVQVTADCVHPGTILGTGLGGSGSEWGVPSLVTSGVRLLGNVVGFSSLEGACTGVYVATMPDIRAKAEHGKYYTPQLNWHGRYVGSHEQPPDTKWGEDDELAARLWTFSEEALQKARA
ncbi:hypothetical protein M408DRAFT_329946 [Serendipita vermifera MAFF 305830]|uniref:Uncharacterized protein n=1 Tax=Serendipita vermifera MAFF 305830 TaxID=933852 RepID=A0A0C3B7Q4_SERVB|nr:hypothetical protein M408DRAFT_329946 [Serendipita vermifera MAFF 305830]